MNIQDSSEPSVRPLFWFSLLLSMVLLCVSLFSCNPEKQLIRKQDRALAVTITSPRTLPKAAAVWLNIHPCANDTLIKFTHDTTVNTLIKNVFYTDTLIKDGTKYIFRTDTAYFEKIKTVYQEKIVTDKELTNRQKDSINDLHIQLGTINGLFQERRTQVSGLKKDLNKKNWLFIITIVSFFVTNILWIKSKVSISGITSSAKSLLKISK